MSLCPVTLDELPIRLEPETGLVADMQMTVAQFGIFPEQPMGERVAVDAAMRLDPERTARRASQ